MTKTFATTCLALLGACSVDVPLTDMPDASAADVPAARGPHCEVTPGATWQDLGSPLRTTGPIPTPALAIATAGGITAIAATSGDVYTDETGAFAPLPAAGLPSGARFTALTHHDGTWWVGTDARLGDTVFRYDASAERWLGRGHPVDGSIVELVSFGALLVVETDADVFVLDDPSSSAYRAVPRSADELVSDVLVTARGVYVAYRVLETFRVAFSADTRAFATVPSEVPFVGDDLAGTDGVVLNTAGAGYAPGYLRLDETDASPVFRFVGVVDGGDTPTWLGRDGTVVAQFSLSTSFGPALRGPFFRAPPDVYPNYQLVGNAIHWFMTSDERGTTLPTGVTGGTLVVRTTNHGRSFAPAAREPSPASVIELASDGTEVLVRVRGEGLYPVFAVEPDFRAVDLPTIHPTFAGVSGVEGAFISRTTEYSNQVPQASYDGGRTWEPLTDAYPFYDTNAGRALRIANVFARDPEGRILMGTVGGITSICCTGSMAPFDYRPGAGVWRFTRDRWRPVNAGMPVEAPPDGFGGPPFRSDIDGLSASAAGVRAVLRRRGVFRLVGDAWEPAGAGLPVDAAVALLSVTDANGLARNLAATADGLFVEDGDAWLPAELEGTTVAIVAQRDLLVRATRDVLFASNDVASSWAALPPLGRPVAHLALSRSALVAATIDAHLHTLSVTCSEDE